MKRFFGYAVLMFLLLIAVALYPVSPVFDCNPASQIIQRNMVDGKGFFATAITDQSVVLQFYLNANTRAWSVIAIDGTLKDRGCVLGNGVDWMFPGEVKI